MGACRYGQGGTMGICPLDMCKMFLCVVKRSVDESFMDYFYNISSAPGRFASRPPRGSIPGLRWGTFVPRPLICPSLKIILRAPCLSCVPYRPPHTQHRIKSFHTLESNNYFSEPNSTRFTSCTQLAALSCHDGCFVSVNPLISAVCWSLTDSISASDNELMCIYRKEELSCHVWLWNLC